MIREIGSALIDAEWCIAPGRLSANLHEGVGPSFFETRDWTSTSPFLARKFLVTNLEIVSRETNFVLVGLCAPLSPSCRRRQARDTFFVRHKIFPRHSQIAADSGIVPRGQLVQKNGTQFEIYKRFR